MRAPILKAFSRWWGGTSARLSYAPLLVIHLAVNRPKKHPTPPPAQHPPPIITDINKKRPTNTHRCVIRIRGILSMSVLPNDHVGCSLCRGPRGKARKGALYVCISSVEELYFRGKLYRIFGSIVLRQRIDTPTRKRTCELRRAAARSNHLVEDQEDIRKDSESSAHRMDELLRIGVLIGRVC